MRKKQKTKNSKKHSQNLTRTHQESSELAQEAPHMLHDVTEPLLKPLSTFIRKPNNNPKGDRTDLIKPQHLSAKWTHLAWLASSDLGKLPHKVKHRQR